MRGVAKRSGEGVSGDRKHFEKKHRPAATTTANDVVLVLDVTLMVTASKQELLARNWVLPVKFVLPTLSCGRAGRANTREHSPGAGTKPKERSSPAASSSP